tara:strand:+ start:328 stop:1815 length:1488 start_codon:yes stop_codon:yes gene_type:complete
MDLKYTTPDGTEYTGKAGHEAWTQAGRPQSWKIGMATPEPEPEVVEPTRRATYVTKTGTVSEIAEERVLRQKDRIEALAAKHGDLNKDGWAMKRALYPFGYTTSRLAEGQIQHSRMDHDSKPQVVDMLKGVRDQVKAEDRRDLNVPVSTLRLCEESGHLFRTDGPAAGKRLPMTSAAWSGMCSLLPTIGLKGADYLAQKPIKERARNFNEDIARLVLESDKQVKMRMRRSEKSPTGWENWGVVGPKFGIFDADSICDALLPSFRQMQNDCAVGQAPRGEGFYDPETSKLQLDCFWHADHLIDPAAGDVFKGGLRVKSADNGGSSISGSLVVWRNDCMNFIIISKHTVQLMRQVHRGNMQGTEVKLDSAAREVEKFMRGFEQDWGFLRKAPITKVELYGEQYNSVPEALMGLVNSGRIKGFGRGVARDVQVQLLLNNWGEEPGESLADAINAITRYAHMTPHGLKRRTSLEEQAGELMPVLVKAARKSAEKGLLYV